MLKMYYSRYVRKQKILLSDKKGRSHDSFFIGMQESDTLFAKLEPLLSKAGLILVDLAVSRRRGSAQVRMTVYSPEGTGTNECAKAHRIAYPEAQAVLGDPDPSLEVASPGIDRVLRSAREWAIFRGKGVSVLLRGGEERIRGRIEAVDGQSVRLACAEGPRVIGLEAVAKARLDSSQEGD
jgi:ribosome maturation factor RimP